MKFKISTQVSEKFSDLMVYIPIIRGFDNSKGEKESLELIKECESILKSRFDSVESLINSPYIKAYFDTFEKFGANPFKIMPTHFALAKRVLEGKSLPNINPIVNIYNALSIKYLTPFGGEDLNTIYGDFVLDIANGDEHWRGISEEKGKNPPKGSLIWKDDFDVSTVALNWRQCERTKLSETSTDGYFIMDGFESVNDSNVRTAAHDLIDTVTRICGGEGEVLYLDANNLSVELNFESKDVRGIELPMVEIGTQKSKKIVQEKIKRSYVYLDGTPEKELQSALAIVSGQLNEDILVSQTSNSKFGDYSSPLAMNLGNILRKNPLEIAQDFALKILLPKSIEKVEAVKPGYLNFYLSNKYLKDSLKEIDENFGKFDEGKGKQIMVEYGQPNTHKSITVGHVKSAITGLSVARLYEEIGYDVIHANYFGDIGPYVAKTIYSLVVKVNGEFKLDLLNEEIVNNSVEYLKNIEEKEGLYALQDEIGRLYVDGSKMSESIPEAGETIRKMNSLLFSKENPLINEIYSRTRELCIKSQDQFFKILGVKYDRQYPESEVFELGKKIVKENTGKIFLEDKGAVIFPGELYGMTRYVFLTSDGNPTYSGKDLGLVNLKFQEYPNMEFSLILTSVEQNEYFKVLLKAISLLYPDKSDKYKHLGFGWLLFNNKKTSSRGGTITFSEMFKEAKESAKAKIAEIKDYSDNEIETISNSIALAGIKFNILSHEFYKDINYDPKSFTSLNGYSAPYIIYSYTRAMSVIKKAEVDSNINLEDLLNDQVEIDLIRKLLEYPSKVLACAKGLTAHLLCEYLFELANTFNSFYTTHSILNAESEEIKKARVLLAYKTSLVIKKGLYLLGIDAIDKM